MEIGVVKGQCLVYYAVCQHRIYYNILNNTTFSKKHVGGVQQINDIVCYQGLFENLLEKGECFRIFFNRSTQSLTPATEFKSL